MDKLEQTLSNILQKEAERIGGNPEKEKLLKRVRFLHLAKRELENWIEDINKELDEIEDQEM